MKLEQATDVLNSLAMTYKHSDEVPKSDDLPYTTEEYLVITLFVHTPQHLHGGACEGDSVDKFIEDNGDYLRDIAPNLTTEELWS